MLNRKHLGWAALRGTFALTARLLAKGQTNFARMLWKFNSVYNPRRQLADHQRRVDYPMTLPDHAVRLDPAAIYVHRPVAARSATP